MNRQEYRRAVRALYLQFTSNIVSRWDLRLIDDLFSQDVPIEVIRSALILGSARRLSRDPKASPLPPVRSFYYFRHIIEEILRQPLPRGYIDYLEFRLHQLLARKQP
ncbi:MAG: hypothetical protein J2P31_05160 [Blastocatellia bacterium]|nr:hypothetical protein [Blastocatellia bacterium]